MLLNVVTDDELLTSQIVKTILLLILAGGILYNLFKIIRAGSLNGKVINVALFLFLSAAFFFVMKAYRVEAALLNSPVYVSGTTIGYCSVFAEGRGIDFEYEIDGRKFRNCNTFHPVSKDSIKVPGGKYFVRVTKRFPGEGRMDFKKKAE